MLQMFTSVIKPSKSHIHQSVSSSHNVQLDYYDNPTKKAEVCITVSKCMEIKRTKVKDIVMHHPV